MLKRIKKGKVMKKGLIFFLIFFWIFSGYPQVWNFPPEVKQMHASATVETFTTSDDWEVPDDVYFVTVETWGAGGGTSAPGNNVRRGGAGGGAYSRATISVTPGTTHSYIIGAGGGTDGSDGGDTYWVDDDSTTLVLAKGGSGNTGTGSASGGQANDGVAIGTSTVKYSGGDGIASDADYSGGGGGGAGSEGDGNPASTNTGGSAQSEYGGKGGDGVTAVGVGQNGSIYGGGGGGSWRSDTSGSAGTTGAQGYIRITYTPITEPNLSSPAGYGTGETTAGGSVSTDQDNGTLYFVVTTNVTSPSQAQVKAGNDHIGTSASYSGTSIVTEVGAQNVSVTGLSPSTTYYFHFMHENDKEWQSIVSTSNIFSTYTIDGRPAVQTHLPTEISVNSVQGQGEVLTDSGSDILSRGFVVATGTDALSDPGNTNPYTQTTYFLIYEDTATGTDIFDDLLFGLATGTDYRYRAYAENSEGFSYGEDIGFSTSDGRPVVITHQPINITPNSAQGQGEIAEDYGLSTTRRGFVVERGLSPLADPGNTDPDSQSIYSLIYDEVDGGTEEFYATLFGLDSATHYRYRAFAENSEGFSYGEDIGFKTELSTWSTVNIKGFKCGTIFFDSRDGNYYQTVQIGDQCWFAEDLRYECDNYYPNAESWSTTHCADQGGDYDGLVYQWAAAMDGSTEEGAQGLCPDGWHIPTDEEWKMLEGAVDSTYDYPDSEWDKTGFRGDDVNDRLKDPEEGWCDSTPCGQSGFNALPAGYRSLGGSTSDVGIHAIWWSSNRTGLNLNEAFRRNIYSGLSGVGRSGFSQSYGYSVRCLRSD